MKNTSKSIKKTNGKTRSSNSTPIIKMENNIYYNNNGHKFLIFAFVSAILIPNYVHIGSLRLSPYLFLLLIMFFPNFFTWILGKMGRIYIFDYFILTACVLAAISLFIHHEISTSIESSGVFFLHTFGSYLLGRYCVHSIYSMNFLCITLSLAVIFILPFAAIEALTGEKPYLRLFGMFGPVHADVVRPSRLGFERVQGSFEHPILFGVFIASLFSLIYFNLKTSILRTAALASIVISTFFSLSVGAYLTLIVQIVFISWAGLFPNNRKRWRNLFLIFLFLYIAVDLASNRTPFNVFVDYLTLNSGNAYNRILIWKYGSEEVLRYPFFGIGMNEWTRPYWMSSSMDNFWLLITVRYGIPVFFLMFSAVCLILWRTGHRQLKPGDGLKQRRGIIISIIAIMISICSVHLWNATYAWLMFIVGSATWLMDAGRPKGAPETSDVHPTAGEKAEVAPQGHHSESPRNRSRAILGEVRSDHQAEPGLSGSVRDTDQL